MTRSEECAVKVDKIKRMLEENALDGILIKKQANFSWLTAGGRGFIGFAGENACGVLLVTKEDIYLAANNIEAPRLMAEELPLESVRLVQTEWWHDGAIVNNLEKEFGLLSDDTALDSWFKAERVHLLPAEAARYEDLGVSAAYALEKGCRSVKQGMTEMEIAGLISAGLWGMGLEPITLLVAADDRSSHYRHYVPTGKKAEEGFIASICARKGGLVVSTTRIVAFHPDFAGEYKKLLEVEQAAFEATEKGGTLGDVFDSIRSAYQKIGHGEEWRKHHQGGMTGYLAREYRGDSSSRIPIAASQAFAWNPSIPGAKCEDTILKTEGGDIRILTPCSKAWPTVDMNGWVRPDVLYAF